MIQSRKKFIVYRSSAGSGKTFTLVREYLALVLQNPEKYRQILAITFTNKAANEMKDRIVRSLMQLSDPQLHAEEATVKYLLPALTGQTGLSAVQIKERASLVLSLILHNYTELAISTIDSFTHRVIRTFAHDLKIPVNFEVELDADNLLSQSVDVLVSQVGSDEKLTRILVDYIEKKAGEEMSWQIEKDLNDFGRALFDEKSIGPIAELRNIDLEAIMTVRRNLEAWKAAWENRVRKLSSEITGMITQAGLGAESFIQKKNSILAYLLRIADGRFDKIKPNSYADKAFRTHEWISAKAPRQDQETFGAISETVFNRADELFNILERELQRYLLNKLLLRHLFSTALLGEIEKILHALCLDNNKLLINEFNRRIAGVVSEQPAPFIYERLGEKYHHYLIDEFQDTSILQWHNLLPLIENSLASNRMNLLVGDAKQAIYRWRAGEAEQFEALPHLIRPESDYLLASRENTLVSHFITENLSYNHRSSPVIVDFNNKLFTFISGLLPENYGASFRQAEQKAAKSKQEGLVRLEQIGHKAGNADYSTNMLERVLTIIHELANDKVPLNEIAILCRDNNKASAIADYLLRNAIPVISSESLLLTQSDKVNFIVAFLKYLDNPSDNIPKAHILHYLNDNGLLNGFIPDGLMGHIDMLSTERFNEIMASQFGFYNYDRMKRLEIFGLIHYITIKFGLNAVNDSYIRFFQDTVLEFIKQRKGGLPEFLEWWEEKSKKASVIIPEGIEAIRIMTIHKAKGLQFPVVIYPFADEQARPTRKHIWVPLQEELAEPLKTAYLPVTTALAETPYHDLYQDELDRSTVDMVNLMYVALTRPEERLYILTDEISDKTDGAKSIGKFLGNFLSYAGYFDSTRDMYEFGAGWEKTGAKPQSMEQKENDADFHPRSALQMSLRYHAPLAWDMDDPEKNREWGTLVHTVMAGINYAGDIETVLQDVLLQGDISWTRYDEMKEMLEKLLMHEKIAGFFDPDAEVRNEPEIMSADGSLFRPDRLLLGPDGVIVIDYKTGRQAESHHQQVKTYARLMGEMNYKVDQAYLLYLNKEPEVVRVI